MGQDDGDRDERPGSTPEPFEVFYLREYPQVVGLLHGLLGSRLVAEELAQETFLVAYRDWDRISRLDNPRAWVRKVAINQRSLFLRAYLRQQTRERDAVVRDEEDSIKLADDHAEVWQAVRTLPPLQAQVIALHYYEDYSVAQVAAALDEPRAPSRRSCTTAAASSLDYSVPRWTAGARHEHRRSAASRQQGPQGEQLRPGRRGQLVAGDRPAHWPAGGTWPYRRRPR
jgi:RNA polymerase sigma-70 factor, ECF subfamily